MTEALSNVAHHAHATSVRVTIRRSTNSVVVEVTDNGIGIDPAANPNGHGLNNLRHRAERLGGTAQFIRNDHGGTTLIWHVPT